MRRFSRFLRSGAPGNGDNGNIYQIANNRDTTRTENFTYDNLNRLTQGSSSGTKWGEAFTVDPWGNMWQRSLVSGKTNYEPLNAPASLQNQLTGFTYDVAGNMIQNGSATYTYDGDNRLRATAGWTYVYDGEGVRVKKSNGSTGTLYWTGTGSEAISESNRAGTDQEEYIFFGAERIARRDVATNAVHYYFSDHLGSASIVTNASGAIEDESDYYPYGGEMVISATAPQNYKFTGKERDAESGLDDFGARFHASALGRFMTPDWDAKPVTVPYAKFGDPQTLNLYSYVENAPVNRADADGHEENHPGACDSNGCADTKELADQTKALKAQILSGGPDEIARHAAKGGAEGSPPPDVQKAINEGTPPSANMISCPNCKYYPKDVQEAVNTHEKQHMKQMAALGLAEAAACSAITSCHRAMELDAYRAESKFVNKRLSELNAEQAKGPLGQQDQISMRVLTTMKTQEDTFFKYPTLLDDK
jgi:RHS repeat-associated protein